MADAVTVDADTSPRPLTSARRHRDPRRASAARGGDLMGGRTLPTECEHGVVLDWGDFGPDPDDGTAGTEPCRDCELAEALKPYAAQVLVEWHPSASIGETDAVRHLVESWCGRLMEELLALGVVDPTVELDMSGTQTDRKGPA